MTNQGLRPYSQLERNQVNSKARQEAANRATLSPADGKTLINFIHKQFERKTTEVLSHVSLSVWSAMCFGEGCNYPAVNDWDGWESPEISAL